VLPFPQILIAVTPGWHLIYFKLSLKEVRLMASDENTGKQLQMLRVC
jgi:hypothetical protein